MTQNELQKISVDIGVDFFKSERRGYYDLAMRYGKCKVTIDLIKQLYNKKNPKILLTYPDNKLKTTWKNEFRLWNYSDENIEYVNFSSLFKFRFSKEFDLFIIDEFHSTSLNEMDICHEIMTNNNYIKTLALSGTVNEDTKNKWGLKLIQKYTTIEAIEAKVLADYKISVHLVNLDTKIKTPNKKGKLLSEKQKYDNYSYVISKMQKDGRNSMHLALSRNRLSTSSIGKIEYVKKLLKSMPNKRIVVYCGLNKVADNLDIPSFHSDSAENSSFMNFMDEKINHLALSAMGKVGVTFPNLDSVILMNFTYNAEETAQILNRAIKLDYNGKIADLHVICLNETPELKKIQESLSMLDKKKIKYI